jgi:hypothetical protein
MKTINTKFRGLGVGMLPERNTLFVSTCVHWVTLYCFILKQPKMFHKKWINEIQRLFWLIFLLPKNTYIWLSNIDKMLLGNINPETPVVLGVEWMWISSRIWLSGHTGCPDWWCLCDQCFWKEVHLSQAWGYWGWSLALSAEGSFLSRSWSQAPFLGISRSLLWSQSTNLWEMEVDRMCLDPDLHPSVSFTVSFNGILVST